MALRPGLATGLPLSACKKRKWDGKLAIETNTPRTAGRQTARDENRAKKRSTARRTGGQSDSIGSTVTAEP